MRGWIFIGMVLILFLYTGFKAQQIMPVSVSRILTWGLTALFFLVMLGWQFIYRGNRLPPGSTPFIALAWTGAIAMGVWSTFVLLSLPIDLGLMAVALFRRVTEGASDPERRNFFAQWIPFSLTGVAGGLSGLGVREALAGPRVEEHIVPVQDLPPGLQGLRIVQISDLHVGPTIRKAYVERVVEQALALKPDVIAVTGDLVDGVVETLASEAEPLSKLKAPFGVYYVTGNHEYYWGADAWIRHVRQLGFEPLLNENRVVEIRGHRLMVAGVTDTSAENFDESHRSSPQRAARSSSPSDFKLLLAHRPQSCFEAEKAGFDLQLSGHTHAGQFFPWNILVSLAHPYYRGLNRHGRMWVYVNAGTGYWGPPLRFAVPSEITLIRLEKQKQA